MLTIRKQLFLAIVLLLVSGNLATAGTSTRTSKPRNITGHYRLHSGEKRNSFEVHELGGGKIKFHLLALWVSHNNPENVHNGEVQGTIERVGDVALYESEGCRISFKFTASGAIVTQAEDAGDCGFGVNVTASGTYRKINSRVPKLE